MTAPRQEQRNAYQGSPPRAWICFRLATQDGATRDFKRVVDTACPVSFIIAPDDAPEFTFGIATSVVSNFGHLQGEWFLLAMPEMGLNALMVGYASQEAVDAVRSDHPDFAGLAGLPLLRLLEFGGNQSEFWVRRLA
jgi:hypothetical protein